jgi:hypothetical protein
MRQCNAERVAIECGYGHNCGINFQMKIQCGMIAQLEENVIHPRLETKLVQLSQLIGSTEKLIELKMKMEDWQWQFEHSIKHVYQYIDGDTQTFEW